MSGAERNQGPPRAPRAGAVIARHSRSSMAVVAGLNYSGWTASVGAGVSIPCVGGGRNRRSAGGWSRSSTPLCSIGTAITYTHGSTASWKAMSTASYRSQKRLETESAPAAKHRRAARAADEYLWVEGDGDYIWLGENALQVRTDDDEVDFAYYFVDKRPPQPHPIGSHSCCTTPGPCPPKPSRPVLSSILACQSVLFGSPPGARGSLLGPPVLGVARSLWEPGLGRDLGLSRPYPVRPRRTIAGRGRSRRPTMAA